MRFWILPLIFSLSACSSTSVRRDRSPSPKQNSIPKSVPVSVKKGSLPAKPTTVPTTPPETAQAQDYEKSGRYIEALQEYLSLSVNSPIPAQQENYRLRSIEILETRLDEGQLQKIAGDSNFGFLRGHALYQLGRISLDRHDNEDAKRYLSSVVSFMPGTDLAFQAEELLSQADRVRYVEPKTVGVILPLSGKNAAIGQRALRGIEMGLGLHEGDSPFKLAIMDSEGNPDIARRSVERLVKEDNVIAIVGSLLSKNASAVAVKANELGVPTLALSQKAGVTEIGPSVFRNSLTSEMQVRQLVRSAIDEMGMRRFAILYPNDAYGTEFANLFWDEVMARGGQITAVQSYNPKETDFRPVAQRLVGTWYIEGREDEFKLWQREKAPDLKKKSARQEKSADDILPPVVDFDAVFIPDSAKVLSQASAFLSYVGVRQVRLLGTNLWNSPGLAKRAGLFADRIVFVDSLPAETDVTRQPKFVRDYISLFKEQPSLIEIQAYDAALILRGLISQGAGSREELTRRLTDLQRFPGALGTLDMSVQREIKRPLVTYTLQGGNPVPFRKFQ